MLVRSCGRYRSRRTNGRTCSAYLLDHSNVNRRGGARSVDGGVRHDGGCHRTVTERQLQDAQKSVKRQNSGVGAAVMVG